jgi:hypothetical protein
MARDWSSDVCSSDLVELGAYTIKEGSRTALEDGGCYRNC